MMRKLLKPKALHLAIMSAVAGIPFTAYAEEPQVEEVLVTGQLQSRSNIETSLTVSTLNADEIIQSASRNVGEIFRTIPGIRSEASSGEGNLNISVRGVPVASGGAKYIQLLEDGMPVLQFGDIIVGRKRNPIHLRRRWANKIQPHQRLRQRLCAYLLKALRRPNPRLFAHASCSIWQQFRRVN